MVNSSTNLSTIVLKVIDGRYFPRTENLRLFWRATFHGKSITSEARECSHKPTFNAEMSWTFDASELARIMGQRSVIRLQCMQAHPSGDADVLGYLIIDARTAETSENACAVLRQLSGIRHGVSKPEIRLSLSYIENDLRHEDNQPPGFVNDSSGTQPVEDSDVALQLGTGVDPYFLTLTLTGMDSQAEFDPQQSYTIHFSIFGMDIESEAYSGSELSSMAEQFELSLQTSASDIREYVTNSGVLSFFLRRGSETVAQALLDISSLASGSSFALERPVSFMPVDGSEKALCRFEVSFFIRSGIYQSRPEDIPTRVSASHQYRVSFDIHSAQMLIPGVSSIYAGYQYPHLGCLSPIYTLPPTSVTQARPGQKDVQTVSPASFYRLNSSFTAFEVIYTPGSFVETINSYPLIVEMWQRAANQKDAIVGNLTVNVGDVMDRGKVVRRDDDTIIWAYDRVHPVFGPKSEMEPSHEWSRLVGNIRVIMAIEDFGAIEDGEQLNDLKVATRKMLEESNYVKEEVVEESEEPFQISEVVAIHLFTEQRNFEDYLAKMEAKRAQLFEKKLLDNLLQNSESWEKKTEYVDELISITRTLLRDFKEREAPLKQVDRLISETALELEKQNRRRHQEIQIASDRLKNEYEHQLRIKTAQNDRLKASIASLESESAELKSKKDALLAQLDQQRSSKPDSEAPVRDAQSRLDLIRDEIAHLRRQCEKSKVLTGALRRRYADINAEAAEIDNATDEAHQERLRRERHVQHQKKMVLLAVNNREEIKKDLDKLAQLKQSALEALNRQTLVDIQRDNIQAKQALSHREYRTKLDRSRNSSTASLTEWKLEDDTSESDEEDDDDDDNQWNVDAYTDSKRDFDNDLITDASHRPPHFPITSKAVPESDMGDDDRRLVERLNSKY